MCKVFYCGGCAGRLGMLRAIVELSSLVDPLSEETAQYVGQIFPEFQKDGPPTTVLEVTPNEAQTSWHSGFYVLEKRPLEFEELLRSLQR